MCASFFHNKPLNISIIIKKKPPVTGEPLIFYIQFPRYNNVISFQFRQNFSRGRLKLQLKTKFSCLKYAIKIFPMSSSGLPQAKRQLCTTASECETGRGEHECHSRINYPREKNPHHVSSGLPQAKHQLCTTASEHECH